MKQNTDILRTFLFQIMFKLGVGISQIPLFDLVMIMRHAIIILKLF